MMMWYVMGGVDPCFMKPVIHLIRRILRLDSGLKANVSEAEHPLLCEGTRRQKGELAITMLVYYKDDPPKLARVGTGCSFMLFQTSPVQLFHLFSCVLACISHVNKL